MPVDIGDPVTFNVKRSSEGHGRRGPPVRAAGRNGLERPDPAEFPTGPRRCSPPRHDSRIQAIRGARYLLPNCRTAVCVSPNWSSVLGYGGMPTPCRGRRPRVRHRTRYPFSRPAPLRTQLEGNWPVDRLGAGYKHNRHHTGGNPGAVRRGGHGGAQGAPAVGKVIGPSSVRT
jgi:hypothetical protein